MAKKADKKDVKEWMYTIISAPHITEKAAFGAEHNHVTFKVPMDATKPNIKAAIETIFGVTVLSVNTLIQKGKNKRFKGIMGRRSDFKKAIIRLKEGDVIDTGVGV